MPSSPNITVLLERTRDAAAALVEDMHHIREIAKEGAPGPSRADMRRLSAVLRRLIVEDDLQRVANPRVGRLKIPASDTKTIIALKPSAHLIVGNNGSRLIAGPMSRLPGNPDHNGRILINADSFRVQPTLCFRGMWVRRLDVIKYVANTLSGVHSNSRDIGSNEYRILSAARACLTRTVNADGSTNVKLDNSLFSEVVASPTYDPGSLDPVLLDLLFTAELLGKTEDIAQLESVIKAELGI